MIKKENRKTYKMSCSELKRAIYYWIKTIHDDDCSINLEEMSIHHEDDNGMHIIGSTSTICFQHSITKKLDRR